jgi:RHS repeat-associated protein
MLCARPVTPARAAFVLAMSCIASGSVLGQSKVLDVGSLSLTTMKMDGLTYVQAVRPLVSQRGVNIDGAARHPSTLGSTFWGNPFGEPWDDQQRLGDVRLDTGTYSPTEVDLALPSIGPAWVIGRTYNCVQRNSIDTGFYNSNTVQGYDWFQTSQPELVYSAGATADEDTLYLVYGADRYIEFQRTGTTSDYFKSKNGAAGIIKHDAYSGSETPTPPGTYTYYDQAGNQIVFFDNDYTSGSTTYATTGQIWKITDTNSKTAYVGDASTISAAIIGGFDSTTGGILTAYDSAERRFTYTYSSSHLASVVAETKAGGTWASPTGVSEVGRVEYSYYTSTVTDQGLAGDLKLVTITTPLSSGTLVRKQYYRYYTGSYNASTNPGLSHQIKLVLGYEGTRNYDYQDTPATANSFDSTGVSAATLKAYSSIYLEYYDAGTASENGRKRIKTVQFNGECGCSGGTSDGTYNLSYEANGSFSNTSGYDTAWKSRVTLTRPDSTYELRYFDEVGQPLSKVVLNAAPGSTPSAGWANYVVRDGNGCVTDIATPEASSYTDSTRAIAESGSTGLVNVTERCDSSLSAFTGKGDLDGLPVGQQYRVAGGGTKYYTLSIDPDSFSVTLSGSIKVVRPVSAGSSAYPTAVTARTDSSRNHTTLTNTAYSSTVAFKQVDTTLPSVATSTNGSGSSNTRSDYYGLDGRLAFSKNERDVIAFRKYDTATGQMTMSIQDADTSNGDFTGITIPTGFSSSGTALHYKTLYAYDPQGRLSTTTTPDGRVAQMYYTLVGDGRSVTLSVPKVSTSGGTTTCYGPVVYATANLAGKTEAQGLIAFSGNTTTSAISSWISTSATDPVGAVSVGSVARLTRHIYDNAGMKLLESDVYFSVPSGGSWPGSSSSNYDPVTFGYDGMGRRWRTKNPAGDITRVTYDSLGRATERWAGTNDHSFTGGEASGTDNMVKLETFVYDGGASGGNSHVTARNLDPDGDWSGGNTDLRTTSYAYDYRGRLIFTTNPAAPHTVTKYDNLGRMVAVGQYDAVGTLSTGTDPTSTASSGGAKRTALNETFYDEMGRVYKAVREKITQSSGAIADAITTTNWYDPAGQPIKTNGEMLTKTRFDRLGRVTHQFTLSKDDDSTYASVYTSGQTDVGGDTVVEENQTVYDNSSKTGLVLMKVAISRHWNESSTTYGSLDSNADADSTTLTAANVKGRVQITSMWYDATNRRVDAVALGSNAIVGDGSTTTGTYSRGSGATTGQPSRSDTALRTTYAYADDGALQDVTDPSNLTTRTLYNAAGRKTATIAHYTGGSISTADRDNDVYTRFVYTKGLMTERHVDLDGDGVHDTDDQVTTYFYGTSTGAANSPSKINSGSLLRAIRYPDSTNSATATAYIDGTSDAQVISYAYNALGQRIAQKDPAGNVLAYSYDKRGRETARAASAAGGFDNDVLEIDTAYLNRGLINTVTQLGASATVKDQLQYSYDDWGNLAKFEQDVDSAIGGGGRAAFSVQYAYAKSGSSTTRNTLRRTGMTMPNGDSLTYAYATGINADLSRVSAINNGSIDLAQYNYFGLGGVVYTIIPGAEAWTSALEYGSDKTYPYWDRFNRPTHCQWEKTYANPAPKFYQVDITYDRDSNVTYVLDKVQMTDTPPYSPIHSFDAKYSLDGLNRLTRAEEGRYSSGSIANRSRDQRWLDSSDNLGLTQTGNWHYNRLDLDGDGTFAGTGEADETRTHDTANKLTAIGAGSISYDLNGNLTDSATVTGYQYVYDAFNRLRKIEDKNGNVLQEYRYNGLGYRIGWHYDADTSTSVTGSDPWYYFCYDGQWRLTATYRESDTSAKEQFYAHCAGLGGYGKSSYVDSVIMRDRDMSNTWTGAADGTLEERRYYCQNWRADVGAVLDAAGGMVEWVKYSAYGVPLGIPAGDVTADGSTTGTDAKHVQALATGGGTAFGTGNYDVRADRDLDGTIDSSDDTDVTALVGTTLGRGVLSRADTANRRGYAGYEGSGSGIDSLWQVRRRAFDSAQGRWLQRDPAGYVGTNSLVAYVSDNPIHLVDPSGKVAVRCTGNHAEDVLRCQDECDRLNPGNHGVWICYANCDRNPCQANKAPNDILLIGLSIIAIQAIVEVGIPTGGGGQPQGPDPIDCMFRAAIVEAECMALWGDPLFCFEQGMDEYAMCMGGLP